MEEVKLEEVRNNQQYKIKVIEYNCDAAQSYGIYQNDDEYKLYDYVSSLSISCGFHSGDPIKIQKSLMLAKEKNLCIGAHIGFPDIQGFGYRDMELSKDELEACVVYQIGALKSFARLYNKEVEFVRFHGAMYDKFNRDADFALNLAQACKKADPWLIIYGGDYENLTLISNELKVRTAFELNIEKVYDENLKPLNKNIDVEKLEHRVKAYLQYEKIHKVNGEFVSLKCDTIHFKNLNALKLANSLVKPSPVNYNKVQNSGWV